MLPDIEAELAPAHLFDDKSRRCGARLVPEAVHRAVAAAGGDRDAIHRGPGDGQSDDIPAMLADGEYVIDAETVAQIGNGSTKAGAQALDKFRESIRAHKRSAPLNKIPPKTKALTSYLKKGK